MEIDISAVIEARERYDAIKGNRPDIKDAPNYDAFVRAEAIWFDACRDAYRALQHRLDELPVIGAEIAAIKDRHAEAMQAMESGYRDLWNHPEFSRNLHSWVEDMFPDEATQEG